MHNWNCSCINVILRVRPKELKAFSLKLHTSQRLGWNPSQMSAIRMQCHFTGTRFLHLLSRSCFFQIGDFKVEFKHCVSFPLPGFVVTPGFHLRFWTVSLPLNLLSCYFSLSLKWFSTCCVSAAVLLSLFSPQSDLPTAQCAWCSVFVIHFPVFPGGHDSGQNHWAGWTWKARLSERKNSMEVNPK